MFGIVLVCVVAVISVSVIVAAVRVAGFSPGEEIISDDVRQVAASLDDTVYPPEDILIFEGDPDTVYLYVSVEGVGPEPGFSVDVTRSGNGSVVGSIFGGDGGVDVSGGAGEQLTPDGTGVVKFSVSGTGGSLPPGNYTVEVQNDGKVIVRKSFVVRDG